MFSFEGVKRKSDTFSCEYRRYSAEALGKVFFAYFLVHKKVCTISSVGRATDS